MGIAIYQWNSFDMEETTVKDSFDHENSATPFSEQVKFKAKENSRKVRELLW